jgi:hypothetical protein
LIGGSLVSGQEELPAQAPSPARERPEHLVVLRLSAAMLNSLIHREIDHQTPVRDIVLGTPVTGLARIVGEPRVQLEPSLDQARFNVVVTGTVHSRTVGRNGPVVIRGHSITHFTAVKQIVFEPGQGFYALPPQVSTEAQCFVDDIQSKRGGIIGTFAVRKATRQIAEQQQELTAIARDRAARRIAATFEHHIGERLVRLNWAVEMRALLANLGGRASNARIVCRTTPHYVEIANAGGRRTISIHLPVLAASEMNAPIEIWIHGSVVPERIGVAVKTMFTNPDQSAILNAMALLPGTFGKDAATAVSALVSENNVAVQSVADWMVVEINTQPFNAALGNRTVRR